MDQRKATNIVWHPHRVTAEERHGLNGHQGAVLWFTGLSASGKSTLANAVEGVLYERRCHSFVLDGDNIRHGLNKDLGFSPEDREENIRRIGEVARLFADAGLIAMTAFISPYLRDRKIARDLNPPGRFIEVYCDSGLAVCERRDPKGLYKKARAGQIREFTGIDAPYEPPTAAEITVPCGTESVEACVAQVIAYLEDRNIIPRAN
jgi:adenylylsulfate kinase